MLRRPDFVLPLAVLELVRQGLLKAVFWHLTDCSARYATRFREGVFAISLVRSLAAAGEKVEDYFDHVRAIVKAFTHCRFAIDDCRWVSSDFSSSKFGVRGPESTAALRGSERAQREFPIENGNLAKAAPLDSKLKDCEPGDRQSPNPNRRSQIPRPGTSDSELANSELSHRQSAIENRQSPRPPLLLTLSTALAQITWRRLRASRRHAEWERRAVVHLFRKLAVERGRGETVAHARLVELGEDLHRVLFYSAGRFERQLERLNHRFEAIAARILKELGAPPPAVHVRPSPAVDEAGAGSLPEALANPFRAAPHVRKRSKARQPRVKPASQWQHSHQVRGPGSRRKRTPEERAEDDSGLDRDGSLKPGAFRASAIAVDDEIEAGQRRPAPPECEDLERFRALVACALPCRPPGAPGEDQPDPVPEGLADALWKRLECSRRQADAERRQARMLLDDYNARLDTCRLTSDDLRLNTSTEEQAISSSEFSESVGLLTPDSEDSELGIPNAGLPQPGSSIDNRQSSVLEQSSIDNRQSSIPDSLTPLATALIVLLRADDFDARIEAKILDFQAQVWIHLMLVTRRAGRKELHSLPPVPPSLPDTLIKAMKAGRRRRDEADALMLRADALWQEWKRWEAVIESGDIRQLRPLKTNPWFDVHLLVSQLGASCQPSAVSPQMPGLKSER